MSNDQNVKIKMPDSFFQRATTLAEAKGVSLETVILQLLELALSRVSPTQSGEENLSLDSLNDDC